MMVHWEVTYNKTIRTLDADHAENVTGPQGRSVGYRDALRFKSYML